VTARRSYSQHCGLARALDVVGERWTLLVVRDLLLGPRRYGDLLGSLEGITTNLLAKRLRELTAAGLLEKRKLSPPVSGEVYALTEAGRELEPVVMELARWGGRLLAHPRRGDRKDIGWALLSMKRRYREPSAKLASGRSSVFTVEIASGERRFELSLGGERLGVAEKASDDADLRLGAASQETLFDLFFQDVPAAALERRGRLVVLGDRTRLPELLGAFLPPGPKAERASGGGGKKALLGRA
jgi:DNA-binding HxlR family transcriptional regulator